eukprot:136295_1
MTLSIFNRKLSDTQRMASLLRKLTRFSTILVLLTAILIGWDISRASGKATAKFTALFRYSATFHPSPINGQTILNNNQTLIGFDNYAQYFSFQTMKYIFSSPVLRWILYGLTKRLPMNVGGVFGHTIGRHIVMDEIIVNEIKNNNAKQLVIFGAGYDSRALRFKYLITKHNINVFEVDLPSTQFGKKSLLKKNNIKIPKYLTFIGVDFGKDNIRHMLQLNGYDSTKQTVFVFEGVSPYLTAKNVSEVLKLVSQFSGINSMIVWDIIHICLGYQYGFHSGYYSDIDMKYCIQNGMMSNIMVNKFDKFIYNSFVSILREPVYFALDWDINDEKSRKKKK